MDSVKLICIQVNICESTLFLSEPRTPVRGFARQAGVAWHMMHGVPCTGATCNAGNRILASVVVSGGRAAQVAVVHVEEPHNGNKQNGCQVE
eukprot:SAG22_NODE_1155_length_5341_cov_12.348531_5_plen_92_part_00